MQRTFVNEKRSSVEGRERQIKERILSGRSPKETGKMPENTSSIGKLKGEINRAGH